MEEAQHVKLSLQVLANCFCGVDVSTAKRATEPANSNEITSKKHLKPLPSFHEIEHKIENVMKSAWDAAQENNALMTLIHYIQIDEPFTDADAIHVVACRALNGLAKSEQIRQILSKLPLIADNELAVLTRGPVLQDKAADHAEFVKEARKLIGTVHQTEVDATTEDLTYDKMVKAKVIKQTKIDFDQVGLQRLIHDYLIQAGLDKTAQTLQVEAGLEAGYSGGTAVTPRTVATPRRLGELKKSAESESTSADRTINSVTSLRTDTASTLNSKESFSKPTVSARKSLGSMGKPNGKLMSNSRFLIF
ncbi:unnamed protein product [Bursaphelenchus okinawaensis]|uniref:LisH domain-containing protein n=1 Tax=Bursaphelenchus okinawaensis TaxID=465554 RepID=A0A811L1N1_9BILA|nr:unnamed protein product [Bursaphelenchus okinawaensis]CAG9114589.1 unnamed protein product [Bursaphelenchus okinawaensis]